ncbi:hypothetical protein IFM89_014622 [Coptis chinensis]|uniref:Nudix hydrolase domain-containing protein n=1 Tax=Coptis chinensis TaxID=261450 RepID=A0A835IQE8_9MAGN|nr:hypothetical protein IFM89_014622 [Coptis chinensis]
MSSVLARQGRHRQRYDNEFRLVAGCIPYRFREDIDDDMATLDDILEVLMISSPNREDLGGWEDDETMAEAACREAMEEAGVKGKIDFLVIDIGICAVLTITNMTFSTAFGPGIPQASENYLGVWDFRSKSSQNSCSLEGYCRGYMFALEVTEEFVTWAEEDNHRRRWLNVADAFRLCRYEWMQSALGRFLRVMSEVGKYQPTKLVETPVVPVQEVLTEHSILSPSCFVMSHITAMCWDDEFSLYNS